MNVSKHWLCPFGPKLYWHMWLGWQTINFNHEGMASNDAGFQAQKDNMIKKYQTLRKETRPKRETS
jgi:hypothetical protein